MQQSGEAEAPQVPLDDRRKRNIAWVECTRCSKWRRLAKEAARDAEKNDTWCVTCWLVWGITTGAFCLTHTLDSCWEQTSGPVAQDL